jgi:hypothetical protein
MSSRVILASGSSQSWSSSTLQMVMVIMHPVQKQPKKRLGVTRVRLKQDTPQLRKS